MTCISKVVHTNTNLQNMENIVFKSHVVYFFNYMGGGWVYSYIVASPNISWINSRCRSEDDDFEPHIEKFFSRLMQ